MAGITLTYKDYDRETGTFRVDQGPTITAETFAAQDALIDTLKAAVAALTEGALVREVRTYEVVNSADVPASSQYAQRETKWMVLGHGTSAPYQKFRWEIPCAKLSLLEDHAKELDITDGVGKTFADAMAAYVKDDGGNAVVIDRVIQVGRNS